ncbi:hypothetical protein ACHAXT_009500 [Thalassiosira profunda]
MSQSQEQAEAADTHLTCDACHHSLPRHLFPKKKFAKDPARRVCRQCKKNETAERCGQPPKKQIKLGRTSEAGAKRRPNNWGYCNYLDKLFAMECFSDIVALRAFTSAKDVSESMAAIQAASQHGGKLIDGKEDKMRVKCLCIGDGSTPRTAVLACFLMKWDCVSIDPALGEEWTGEEPKGVRGLTGFGGTLEDFVARDVANEDKGAIEEYDRLVLLCVHSHARLTGKASVPNLMARYHNIPTTLVSLPCCPRFRSQKDVGRPPDARYDDDGVFSACRSVEVWNFDVMQTVWRLVSQ